MRSIYLAGESLRQQAACRCRLQGLFTLSYNRTVPDGLALAQRKEETKHPGVMR